MASFARDEGAAERVGGRAGCRDTEGCIWWGVAFPEEEERQSPVLPLAVLVGVHASNLAENDRSVRHGLGKGKVALRNLRRDAIDKVKKQEKDGDFSEDQSRDEQDAVQKTLDKFIAELEKHLADKEADILKV